MGAPGRGFDAAAEARIAAVVRDHERQTRTDYNRSAGFGSGLAAAGSVVWVVEARAESAGGLPVPGRLKLASFRGAPVYEDVGDGTADCYLMPAGAPAVGTPVAALLVDHYDGRPLFFPFAGSAPEFECEDLVIQTNHRCGPNKTIIFDTRTVRVPVCAGTPPPPVPPSPPPPPVPPSPPPPPPVPPPPPPPPVPPPPPPPPVPPSPPPPPPPPPSFAGYYCVENAAHPQGVECRLVDDPAGPGAPAISGPHADCAACEAERDRRMVVM